MELEAVEQRHLATTIADRLRQYIVSGRFHPGDRLPSERELAGVLKVTRTTLREALKILETLRFVTIRQGDGVRVRDYLRSANIEILADLLFRGGRPDPVVLANILEAREMFGRILVRLAASRARPDHIRAYRDLVDRLDGARGEPSAVQVADLDCFQALAEATQNLVFVFVLNAIRAIYLRHRGVFASLYREPDRVAAAHREVLRALEARDPDRAERAAAPLLEIPVDLRAERAQPLEEEHHGEP